MNNEPYYGVTRTDEYLAHYGIKGMKWGVRKARESGNARALGRQYRKAQKKLAKLEARANNGKKYARRAALLGAGAAAAGGVAAVGTTGLGRAANALGGAAARGQRAVGSGMSALGRGIVRAGIATRNGKLATLGSNLGKAGAVVKNTPSKLQRAGAEAYTGLYKWGNAKSGLQTRAGRALEAQGRTNLNNAIGAASRGHLSSNDLLRAGKVGKAEIAKGRGMQYTNNQLLRAGAAALGAGLAGGAAYNAYRAATTKRAARKAAQFRSEMNKAFAGTQYDRRRKKNRRG